MTIKALQVPPIGTNCYLLKDDETGLGAVIDPGGAPEDIRAAVQELNMTPTAILLTHGHYDHTGAVTALKQVWPDIPVYLHQADAALTEKIDSLMPPIGQSTAYGEGDTVSIGTLQVSVLHTPGHTPGSVTLQGGDVLVTGDTLCCGSCGRTDLPWGCTEDMMASLKRLAGLEGDWRVFPGHESPSTLERERRGNYYMLHALGR